MAGSAGISGGKGKTKATVQLVAVSAFLAVGAGGIARIAYSRVNPALTIHMSPSANARGVLQTTEPEIILYGKSKSEGRLVLHINDQENVIESDGEWRYVLSLDALEEQSYYHVYVSCEEDNSVHSRELEFYIGSEWDSVNEAGLAMPAETGADAAGELEPEYAADEGAGSGEETEGQNFARFYGVLSFPEDGDVVQADFRLKAIVLADSGESDFAVYADIMSGDKCIYTEKMEYSELSELSLNSNAKKYKSEIDAVLGYDVKGTIHADSIPAGEYSVNLRLENKGNGEDVILDSALITIEESGNDGDGLLADWGLEEYAEERSMQYIFEDEGFAIGMDTAGTESVLTVNAEQILLTGWLAAPGGTSLGVFCQIDSADYTADMLFELGGALTITRAGRNLETMDLVQIGESNQELEEEGYIICLKLPFLEEGTHMICITANVGVAGQEVRMVDFPVLTVTVEPSVAVEENAVQRIIDTWEEED